MRRFMKKYSVLALWAVMGIAVLVHPALLLDFVETPAKSEAGALGWWFHLSVTARYALLAVYWAVLGVAPSGIAFRAVLRKWRRREGIRVYGIYSLDQEGRRVKVDSSTGGTAEYDVLSREAAYEEFHQRYGNMRLMELFGKLYPIVILGERLGLESNAVECRLLSDPERGGIQRFELSAYFKERVDELEAVHEEMLKKDFAWYDDLARLKSCKVRPRWIPFGPRIRMTFEICNYLDYVVTNYSVELQRAGDGSVREHLDTGKLPHRRLPSLKRSVAANQLGLNAMIVTSDGRMIAAQRSEDVFTFPGLWAPPVSGTQMFYYKKDREIKDDAGQIRLLRQRGPAHDYFQWTVLGDGIPNPFAGVVAQAEEEINLKKTQIGRVQLIGINRDLTRGGLPDAFFVFHLKISKQELMDNAPENARDSWEWKDDKGQGLYDFGPDLRNCTYRELEIGFRTWLDVNPATPALVSAIYFFLQYFRSHRDEF